MNKLTLNDSPQTAMMKLCNGNPGALVAMMKLIETNATTDPDNAFGNLNAIMQLDEYGIYGTDIYVLFSDLCGKNPVLTIAVLRAVQLGYLDRAVLKDACSRQDYSGRQLINVVALYNQVCERLPDFDKAGEGVQGE